MPATKTLHSFLFWKHQIIILSIGPRIHLNNNILIDDFILTSPLLRFMRVEDRLDILDLISRYSMTYDHNEIDKHVSLFTEDGTLVLTHEATGHEARRKMTGERRAKVAEKGIQNRHFLVNTVLDEVSVDEVEAVSNFLIT